MMKRFFLTIIYFLCIFKCTSQSIYPFVQNVAGKDLIQSTSPSLEYSVGESSSIEFFRGSNGISLNTGFLQSYLSVITAITDNTIIPEGVVEIYPNPASNYVNINFKNSSFNKYFIRITDIETRQVINSTGIISTTPNKQFNIKNIPAGIYLVTITLENQNHYKQVRTYRFFKQ